eukprot:2376919-Rhodomonas_salina.1
MSMGNCTTALLTRQAIRTGVRGASLVEAVQPAEYKETAFATAANFWYAAWELTYTPRLRPRKPAQLRLVLQSWCIGEELATNISQHLSYVSSTTPRHWASGRRARLERHFGRDSAREGAVAVLEGRSRMPQQAGVRSGLPSTRRPFAARAGSAVGCRTAGQRLVERCARTGLPTSRAWD